MFTLAVATAVASRQGKKAFGEGFFIRRFSSNSIVIVIWVLLPSRRRSNALNFAELQLIFMTVLWYRKTAIRLSYSRSLEVSTDETQIYRHR
jgi:hypothetical protein